MTTLRSVSEDLELWVASDNSSQHQNVPRLVQHDASGADFCVIPAIGSGLSCIDEARRGWMVYLGWRRISGSSK
jgi:hypothetical protein